MSRPHLVLLSPHHAGFWAPVAERLAGEAHIEAPLLWSHDTIRGMADSVLRACAGPVSVAGACLGGLVALEMLRIAPQRVARICLINATARPDEPWRAEQRQARIERLERRRRDGVRESDYLPGALVWMLAPRHQACDPLRRAAAEALAAAPLEAVIRQQRALLARADARGVLRLRLCPTLVIAGGEDRMHGPACSLEIAELAGVEAQVLSPCGHLAVIEQPQVVARLMRDWLRAPVRTPEPQPHAGACHVGAD